MTEGLNNRIFGGDSSEYKLSVSNMLAGLAAGVKNDTSIFNPMDLQTRLEGMITTVHNKAMAKKYEENKTKGAKFLEDNAKKPGVKTLPSGVQYKVIKEGTGATPDSTARVKVNYEGKLIDGTVFDSSYQRGQPAEMGLNMPKHSATCLWALSGKSTSPPNWATTTVRLAKSSHSPRSSSRWNCSTFSKNNHRQ